MVLRYLDALARSENCGLANLLASGGQMQLEARAGSPVDLWMESASSMPRTALTTSLVTGGAGFLDSDFCAEPLRRGPGRCARTTSRQPEISLARDVLGWEPSVSLRDGRCRTIDAMGAERLVGTATA